MQIITQNKEYNQAIGQQNIIPLGTKTGLPCRFKLIVYFHELVPGKDKNRSMPPVYAKYLEHKPDEVIIERLISFVHSIISGQTAEKYPNQTFRLAVIYNKNKEIWKYTDQDALLDLLRKLWQHEKQMTARDEKYSKNDLLTIQEIATQFKELKQLERFQYDFIQSKFEFHQLYFNQKIFLHLTKI